jgi:phosphoglycerol transferase MdoB-like AlkP superfamily enzyme
MIKRIKSLACYSIFWLCFFIIARIFFLIVQFKETLMCKPVEILGTFWHGFQMDVSVTGYLLLIPLLLSVPGTFFNGRWYKVFMKFYTYFLIIIFTVIIVVDAELYTFWGFRMDSSLLDYLKTPKDAMASVDTPLVIYFIISFLLLAGLSIYLFKKLIYGAFNNFERLKYWYFDSVLFLLLLGSMIIPIRGGFSVAAMNTGFVYFNDKPFPNHTAINVIWNLANSAIYRQPDKNPYSFGNLDEAYATVKMLTESSGETDTIIRPGKPNILLFIIESFGSAVTRVQKNDSIIAPCFNKLKKEGVFFDNFYSAGYRTDRALPGILNGYPSLTKSSIIQDPKKTQSLPGLGKLLLKEGYNTRFWYGGDLNFANFSSDVINSGFQTRITESDFEKKYRNSKWGIHDGIVLDILYDSLNKARQPFCDAVLTLSSHEPFEVPMKTVFKGTSVNAKFKNSIFYTDSCLGAFIDRAKKTSWWNNTLVIMVADHCRRLSPDAPAYSDEIFQIPMLWLGGALVKKGVTIDKIGSQIDITKTLAGQLGLKEEFPFAKNLLTKNSKSFAFYTFIEGFVFVTDTSYVVYDHAARKFVVQRGNNPQLTEKYGKSYLQAVYDDYLKR